MGLGLFLNTSSSKNKTGSYEVVSQNHDTHVGKIIEGSEKKNSPKNIALW